MKGEGKTIPLFLADEQELYRQGLRQDLSRQAGIEVLGEAATGEEALAQLESLPPEVVVVCSFTLPGFSHLVRQVQRRVPSAAIVALAEKKDGQDIFQALSAGAVALLTRGAGGEGWARTIREASEGEIPITRDVAETPAVARLLLQEFQGLQQHPALVPLLVRLCSREERILTQLAGGLPLQDIASALGADPQVLLRSLASVCRKLVANGHVQQAALALRGAVEAA